MSPDRAALIFDFDGTIVDTETPVYESWRATFVEAGVTPIDFDTWSGQIGQADSASLDVRAVLCAGLGVDALPKSLEDFRRRRRDELLEGQAVRPGVLSWIEAAAERGLALGVASSSTSAWVVPHLVDRGLRDRFAAVVCADPPRPGKPHPAVFTDCCAELGVASARAVAIEDSVHGVTAAKAAGMRCLAVPGPITRGHDFGHADASADSLASLNPSDWLL